MSEIKEFLDLLAKLEVKEIKKEEQEFLLEIVAISSEDVSKIRELTKGEVGLCGRGGVYLQLIIEIPEEVAEEKKKKKGFKEVMKDSSYGIYLPTEVEINGVEKLIGFPKSAIEILDAIAHSEIHISFGRKKLLAILNYLRLTGRAKYEKQKWVRVGKKEELDLLED